MFNTTTENGREVRHPGQYISKNCRIMKNRLKIENELTKLKKAQT